MLQRDERRAIGRPGFEADLRHRRDSLGPFLHEVAAAEVHSEPDRVVDSVADLEVVPSGQGAPVALIQVVKTDRDWPSPASAPPRKVSDHTLGMSAPACSAVAAAFCANSIPVRCSPLNVARLEIRM